MTDGQKKEIEIGLFAPNLYSISIGSSLLCTTLKDLQTNNIFISYAPVRPS